MRARRSLRLRVAASMAALAVLTVGVHSVLLFSATERMEEELVDEIVVEELQHFIGRFRDGRDVTRPVSEKLAGYYAPDPAARARLPAQIRDLGPGRHEVFVRGVEHHVAVRDEPEGRFVLVYDVEHHEERVRRFALLLLAGGGLTVLAAAALGYWAAGWLVRPVRALADRVARLGPQPPGAPLAPHYAEEEVQHLARAFDGYLRRIAEFIEREQEFTGNLSHELRTPLTAIRTSCELLLQDAALPEGVRGRIAAIDRAAARITETARALLYLARGGDAPRAEEIPLRECIAEAAEHVLPILERKGIAYETDIDPAAMVRADRTALYLVVDNLLRNAAHYTERGRVRAAYRDGRLLIEDTGPGIDPAVLPRIGERFNRGAPASGHDGTGLGLVIVKRICERLGWTLEIESAPGRGTRAGVRFPLPSSQDLHAASTRS